MGRALLLRESEEINVRGASIYDVRTEGGGGVSPKADIVLEISKGGCVNFRTRGRGVQNPKNFTDVINGCPLVLRESVRCSVHRADSDRPRHFFFNLGLRITKFGKQCIYLSEKPEM